MTGLREPMIAGRYRIERPLGGGTSQVCRATDLRLGRTVVVKIARTEAVELDTGRFQNETRLLAGLRHPGLVTLYDAGTVDDRPYLVMQYVPGGSLAGTLRAGPLPQAQVEAVGVALAEALAYLHEHHVIHRDLKPGNVLLGADGRVYLADFGIARTLDAARVTATGLVIGTPAYLSPEQARGEAATPASDMYALGLILLECLTGHREYPGAPIEAAVARLYRPPAVPAELPAPWPRLIGRLTADDSAVRPTARQVIAELSGAGDSTLTIPLPVQPAAVPPGPPPEQEWAVPDPLATLQPSATAQPPATAPPLRRRWRLAGVLLAGLALSGGIGLAATLSDSAVPAPAAPAAPADPATSATRPAHQPLRSSPAGTPTSGYRGTRTSVPPPSDAPSPTPSRTASTSAVPTRTAAPTGSQPPTSTPAPGRSPTSPPTTGPPTTGPPATRATPPPSPSDSPPAVAPSDSTVSAAAADGLG
jgi:serine/threonine protein kinase